MRAARYFFPDGPREGAAALGDERLAEIGQQIVVGPEVVPPLSRGKLLPDIPEQLASQVADLPVHLGAERLRRRFEIPEAIENRCVGAT